MRVLVDSIDTLTRSGTVDSWCYASAVERFTRSRFVFPWGLVPTVDVMGMREWIEEGRFVASLAGYALTGDTLHHGSSTWSVLGMRAEVVEGSVGRVTTGGASPDGTETPRTTPEISTPVVLQITTADDTRILVEAPAKRLRQAHDLALKINQANAYFTDRRRSSPDPARIR